jgi:LysR family transcriptional regulator, transcriptional activator for dmlA
MNSTRTPGGGASATAGPATARPPAAPTTQPPTLARADLELLLHIAEGGSLVAAARRLDRGAPGVSKQLAALETRLGARLLHRTTRRLQFTAEGEAVLAHAREIVAGFERLDEALAGRRDAATGRLRIASSPGFGRLRLAPVLATLQAAHPGLEIDLQLADHLPDLAAGRFDAAVWLWTPTRGSWITRRLARNRRVVVAAPAYLARHGTPQAPADLARHDCLVVRENDESAALWRLSPLGRRAGAPVAVRVSGPLASNHGEVVRDWALAGHGLMLRSLWDVAEPLARGELVQVLPGWAMLDADVHLLLPPRQAAAGRLPAPRRVQLLQAHLVAAFAAEPWLGAAGAGVAVSAAGGAAWKRLPAHPAEKPLANSPTGLPKKPPQKPPKNAPPAPRRAR